MKWVSHIYGNHERRLDQINGASTPLSQARLPCGFSPQWKKFLAVTMYSGMFLLPIAPLLLAQSAKYYAPRKIFFHRHEALAFFLVLIFTFSYIQTQSLQLPCMENFFYNTGLGPVVLKDTVELSMLPNSYFNVRALLAGAVLDQPCLRPVHCRTANNPVHSFRKEIFSKRSGCARSILPDALTVRRLIYTFLLVNVYMFDRYVILLSLMTVLMCAISMKDSILPLKKKWSMLCVVALDSVPGFSM
jgi:hypothetical protein